MENLVNKFLNIGNTIYPEYLYPLNSENFVNIKLILKVDSDFKAELFNNINDILFNINNYILKSNIKLLEIAENQDVENILDLELNRDSKGLLFLYENHLYELSHTYENFLSDVEVNNVFDILNHLYLKKILISSDGVFFDYYLKFDDYEIDLDGDESYLSLNFDLNLNFKCIENN